MENIEILLAEGENDREESLTRQWNGEASYVERVDSLVINHSENYFSPFLSLN